MFMFKIGSGFLAENPPHVKITGAKTAPGPSPNLSPDRPHFEENPQNCPGRLPHFRGWPTLSLKHPPFQGGWPKLSQKPPPFPGDDQNCPRSIPHFEENPQNCPRRLHSPTTLMEYFTSCLTCFVLCNPTPCPTWTFAF